MFIVVPSTPAQYFHVLRRQANLPYQRPLIVATPKFLHHHRPATSALQDFTTGAACVGLFLEELVWVVRCDSCKVTQRLRVAPAGAWLLTRMLLQVASCRSCRQAQL
jgi:Transketolase, pyrimidine binding domain